MKNLTNDITEVLSALPLLWSAAPRIKHVLTIIFITLIVTPVLPVAMTTLVSTAAVTAVTCLVLEAVVRGCFWSI